MHRLRTEASRTRDEIGALAQDFNRMASKLQVAWQRQGELTSNVSHELRSPLARLKVALELARRKTGELTELDRIDAEAERLDGLVGQLLTFSKLDADMRGERAPIRLSELIDGVIEDVRFGHAGQPLRIDFSGDEAILVTAHAGAVRQLSDHS